MKNYFFGTILSCFFAFTATAQEECVTVESDVARLECFDNAFKAMLAIEPKRNADDIFSELLELSQYEDIGPYGEQIFFKPTYSSCTFQSRELSRSFGKIGMSKLGNFSGKIYTLNLHEVDTTQSTPSSLGYSIVMQRDKGVEKLVGSASLSGDQGSFIMQDPSIENFGFEALNTTIYDSRLWAKYSNTVTRSANRSEYVPLVPPAYREDAARVASLFTELISACK